MAEHASRTKKRKSSRGDKKTVKRPKKAAFIDITCDLPHDLPIDRDALRGVTAEDVLEMHGKVSAEFRISPCDTGEETPRNFWDLSVEEKDEFTRTLSDMTSAVYEKHRGADAMEVEEKSEDCVKHGKMKGMSWSRASRVEASPLFAEHEAFANAHRRWQVPAGKPIIEADVIDTLRRRGFDARAAAPTPDAAPELCFRVEIYKDSGEYAFSVVYSFDHRANLVSYVYE